jgi:hypothetical protein
MSTIAATLAVGPATVQQVRTRSRQAGLDAALHERPRSGHPRRVTARGSLHHHACLEHTASWARAWRRRSAAVGVLQGGALAAWELGCPSAEGALAGGAAADAGATRCCWMAGR